jgi:hypothetical protein
MEVLGSAKRWQWVFDVFSIFDSVCSWFLSMICVLSVQKVIFFLSKFDVFVCYHWGCSYEVGV